MLGYLPEGRFTTLKEAILAMQHLIDWIDEHAMENPGLIEMSKQIGYSPYYCSEQFHRVAGITIKEYMARRRLSMAALAIRDTNCSLMDIALDYGFSSQSALTRAFVNAFGCTPAAYRRNPTPIPIQCRKYVISPSNITLEGDFDMSNLVLPSYRMEFIPKHKYLGVYKASETANGPIWPNHDCDLLCGTISSMTDTHPIVTAYTAGWAWESGEKNYFFGAGVACDYAGEVPEGFELRECPESYYIVFSHPPFDYLTENAEVMKRVEDLAWNFDPKSIGYEWNEDVCQDYQRHYPEGLGYQILRPVRKMQ